MKKIVQLVIVALVACTVRMQAESSYNPILTSVYSLGISPDAVASGIGDIGAATAPDVYSQYWNASKYAFIESPAGFSMSYTPWLAKLVSDINLASLSGYYKLGDNQAISASFRYFSLGEVILKESYGDQGYSINPYETILDVAYSRKLSDRFSMAITLRGILSDLMSGEDPAGIAGATDISMYYRNPLYFGREPGSLSFGLNMSNIGSKISYDGGNTNYFLPANLKLGGSLEYPIDHYNKINFSADINKLLVPTPKDSADYGESISPIQAIFTSFSDAPGGAKEELQEIYGSIGAEYVYNNQFSVRTGYYYENAYKGNRKYYTFGAGFKMNMLKIDASYLVAASQSNPLDGTLRFSLAFDIEGIRMLLGK